LFIDDANLHGYGDELEKIKNWIRKHVEITDIGPTKQYMGVDYELGKDKIGLYGT
jgi:hypothetical protein